jgi:hypothetical protein
MRKLELIVEGREKDEAITVGTKTPPPCFESSRQYEAWLDAADPELGSQPPTRKDWPLEPNYCRDCNPTDRAIYRAEGRCLFPDTVFITVGDGEDEELVGTTR